MRRRATTTLLAAAACLVAGGCGPAGGPTIRLEIDLGDDVVVPDDLDQIVLTVTAGDPSNDHTCEPLTRTADLEDDSIFPMLVSIDQGEQYRAWVVYRVVGNLVGPGEEPPEEVFSRQARAYWPSSGAAREEVVIDGACLRPGCADGEQCEGGSCSGPIPAEGVFQDDALRDDVPCSAEE